MALVNDSRLDRAHHKTHLQSYNVAVVAMKETFFSATIASAPLFKVVHDLIKLAFPTDNEILVLRCGSAFAKIFAGKISLICSNLKTKLRADLVPEVSEVSACLFVMINLAYGC